MAVPLKQPERPWQSWDTVEDLPPGVRATLERALMVPMWGDQELDAMERAIREVAVRVFREMFCKERAFLLEHKLKRYHPEMKRRAMYRAIALHLNMSENTVRLLLTSRIPAKDAVLLDLKEGA